MFSAPWLSDENLLGTSQTGTGLCNHNRIVLGDVVLDSVNNDSRDDDNILDQIYKSKYVLIIFIMILILHNIIRKCILTQQ